MSAKKKKLYKSYRGMKIVELAEHSMAIDAGE